MDFLVEFVLQLVIQFVVQVVVETLLEGVFHGLAPALRSRSGQSALTAVIGLAFGLAWGWHLADRPQPPKLLWVSVTLAIVAIALRRGNRDSRRQAGFTSGDSFWSRAMSPPWNWPPTRWTDFAVLNVAITAGISLGYLVGQ